ncbi:MAG: DUF3450 family protein [Chitinivibrionales bacterium]|nr:DUF3450 family protein [Chitinivibrionales bacterium]
MHKYVCYSVLIVLSLTGAWQLAAQEIDFEKEASSLRKEISRVESQRSQVRQDRAKDQKEFADYLTRLKRTTNSYVAETDSVRMLIQASLTTKDSVAVESKTLEQLKREYELRQESFRNRLMAECDSLFLVAQRFPPLVSGSLAASIQFLKGELAAKGIYNNEGMNRLAQVTNDMEEFTSTIQILQESSPVPDIRGTVYRIRIGCVFEGVVDEKGTKAALWNGYDSDKKPLWTMIASQSECDRLFKAIQIREGKSLPDFVELPFLSASTASPSDSVSAKSPSDSGATR